MSIINKLEREHNKKYREHSIVKDGSKYQCEDCKLNPWDDDFPEYCIGPTSFLDLGILDTNEECYRINAKVFHIYSRALIEFDSGEILDDKIILDLDFQDLTDLISKIKKIEKVLNEE